jgi:hypothetical protein
MYSADHSAKASAFLQFTQSTALLNYACETHPWLLDFLMKHQRELMERYVLLMEGTSESSDFKSASWQELAEVAEYVRSKAYCLIAEQN